jgi:hypothetical protein
MSVTYSLEQMQHLLALLDGLTIKGVDSAAKLLQIAQTLNSPIEKKGEEQ